MRNTQEENKHGIPGKAESFWITSSAETDYPVFSQDVTLDAAIIGGGFVGIASAMLLKEAGLKVAIIEARRIVSGVTGFTTAKVSSLHRLIYKHITDAFGHEKAAQYAEANQTAIDKIETIIREKNIDCDFSRLPFYTFAETDEYLRKIEEEVKAAQKLGLNVSFTRNVPLPFSTKGAIRLENQAQFHPRKFLLPLARAIPGNGSFIFENTRVVDVTEGDPCTIITDKGKFKARNVIVATNFPIHDKKGFYFARMEVMRSYVLGIRVNEPFPEGMFINAEMETGHSYRSQPAEGGEILIIGGNDHLTGHAPDTVKRYQDLAKFVNRIYTNPRIEYSWSTQDNITVDRVPYIGKLTPGSRHLYTATGFGQWGMTTSIAAAVILADLVQGNSNPWAELFDSFRIKPDASAAKELVTRNLSIVKQFVAGKISDKAAASQIAPGEGKIAEVDNQRAAAYRDEQGKLFALSPFCTHLGCTVTWNNAEKTWDCPCHGSRYDFNGDVIQSPTVKGLVPLKGTMSKAPPADEKIASTADVPPGKMIGVESRSRKILLAALDGNYYAIGNTCTHMGCTLSEGKLDGENVQCPCHGSTFNVKTGEVVHGPAETPEPVYRLRIEGDQIFLIV